MRLISLNIWGGRLCEPLMEFLKSRAQDIDIFCLQEVFHNGTERTVFCDGEVADIFYKISEIFPKHDGYFHATESGEWGLAMFINHGIDVEQVDDIFVHRYRDAMEGQDATTLGRNLQYAVMHQDGKTYTIGNFHGIWNNKDKLDSEERLEQSRKIKAFLDKCDTAKVLAGDFNLLPDTESIKTLETNMRNLITENNITATRSEHYTKEPKFADYVFVSFDVNVKDFKVMQDSVSDHLPLMLEFE